MSFRGRVIRRQPVAVFDKPRSIREQKEQYNYLSRVLGMRQYQSYSWNTVAEAISWLKNQGKLVLIKSVYGDWNGPQDALALVLPVGKVLTLSLFSNNIQGTSFVEDERSGYVYKKADGSWDNSTDAWLQSGGVQEQAAGVLSIVANSTAIVGSYLVGSIVGDYEYGWWEQAGGFVQACYYVHPFFARLAAKTGFAQTSTYLEEKVY